MDSAETEDTGVFSPEATETPITKQLEDFDKKNVKRKRYFYDALNAQNSDDDSYDQCVVDGDSFDNFEKQINNEKRAKRFRLSLEVPSNDSNGEDTGVGSLASQEENQNKRKKRFVATSTQKKDDSTYSDIFKSASQGENIKRKSRFAPPSFVESDDSLLLSNVFKSSSKDKKRNAGFKVPKSPVGSQDSERYSDVFKPLSQDEKNKKRKPRFVLDQDSCDNSGYSDILKSSTKKKEVKRKNRFTIPSCSQDTEDSRQYSEIFESVSKNVIKTERKNRFAVPSFQDCEDSLHYSDISIEQKDNKKFRFEDPVSQRTEDSLRYSDISIQQNDTTVDPYSQDKGESVQNSNVSIEMKENINQENSLENTYDREQINDEKTSSSVATSIRSICIDTIGSSLSILKEKNTHQESRFENTNDKEQTKCEKTSSTVSTSVRSIYIDMVRSSLNASDLLSVTEEANKPFNQTYDVSTSAFCNRQDVSSLENVNMLNLDELKNHSIHQETFTLANNAPVISSLNASNEQTLIGSQEDADQSATLIESKDESSTVNESVPVTTDESKNGSSTVNESIPVTTDESKDESSAVNESIPVTTDASKEESSAVNESKDESENESSIAHESIPVVDESKTESFNEHESVSASSKSENESTNTTTRKSVPALEGIPDLIENFNDKYDKVVESNVTPAMSVHSIMIDTIPNSSNATLPIEKVVEESVYVGFNPSSLMISVTEMVEQTSNSINNNVSDRLEELPKSNDSQSGETPPPVISSPVVALNEENIKEHDYAMVHVTNAEEPVNELVVDPVSAPSVEEVLKESTTKEVIISDSGEIAKEPATASVNVLPSEETPQEPKTQTEALESKSASNNVPSAEETAKAQDEIQVDVPCTEIMPESSIMPPTNDEQISKKSPLSNASTQSANYPLRRRKSRSSVFNEQKTPVDLANLPPSSPSAQQPSANKSSASIPHSNVVEPHEESNASNALASKSNYSLRKRNSRSFVGKKSPEPVPTAAKKSPTPVPTTEQKSPAPAPSTSATAPVQKTPEPVPSSSAAALNNDRLDDTGDALFNFSNSMNDIPSRNFSEILSQAASYSSRSRNSSSSQTFGSKSSVSVFSISKIGRRSSAPKEFKVPQVPKIVPKKKKKTDPSLKHLPSRPNFPQFDFYCNKRFYDYLTSKMQPKYGIRTNNKAVELAKYISEVVKEVIAMKTGKHHILIEEMKKVLFKAGIVTTHYNFYMFCFDYLPPWFRRKAIPMMQPVNRPPNVQFDVSLVFNSIG